MSDPEVMAALDAFVKGYEEAVELGPAPPPSKWDVVKPLAVFV